MRAARVTDTREDAMERMDERIKKNVVDQLLVRLVVGVESG